MMPVVAVEEIRVPRVVLLRGRGPLCHGRGHLLYIRINIEPLRGNHGFFAKGLPTYDQRMFTVAYLWPVSSCKYVPAMRINNNYSSDIY